MTENGVYDLSFHLSSSCEMNQREASFTIYSGIIEDEVANDGFAFTRTPLAAHVYNEPLTDAPDKRKYAITCTYQP